MAKLYLHVSYKLKKDSRASFLSEISRSGLLSVIRAEEGCLEYGYYIPAEDEDALLLLEVWNSEEAQQKHLRQPHMELLRQLKERYIFSTKVLKLTERED